MAERVLVVDNVRKSIKGREIIKGISMELEQGEVLGFLGRTAQASQLPCG